MAATETLFESDDAQNIEVETFISTIYCKEETSFRWDITNISELLAISQDICLPVLRSHTSDWKWNVAFHIKEGVLEVYPKETLMPDSHVIRSAGVIGIDGTKYFENVAKNHSDSRSFQRECLHLNYADILPLFTPGDVLTLECSIRVHYLATSENYIPKPVTCRFKEDFKKFQANIALCDAKVHTGNEYILVHKAILSARSSEFSRVFQTDMSENKDSSVEVDMEFPILQDFITFIYSGEIKEMTWDKAVTLYYAAYKFDVPDLSSVCTLYLQSSVNTNKACKLLLLADLYEDEDLKKFVVNFISQHISVIRKTPDWKELENENLVLAVECLTASLSARGF